ncbi:TPM domain-containing protein [Aridibaculum aurantiacum]|uniref:TPM domain-containing protein n=1 Tax=Aridibaculum aurantiacum TaxID=2810307 RepID=UPI001A9611A1|nr:TPM domain-containing protein [Aridibaculum aurantiacum]
MGIFSFGKKRQFFTPEQQALMVEAIKEAERNTSGEVRVFIESKCEYVNAVDRAQEIFFNLQMEKTQDRNAVLLYMAMDDHQLALFADEGIYQRLGKQYWEEEVRKIISEIKKDHLVEGICTIVTDIGQALKEQFPYDDKGDKNELPDEIIFGH